MEKKKQRIKSASQSFWRKLGERARKRFLSHLKAALLRLLVFLTYRKAGIRSSAFMIRKANRSPEKKNVVKLYRGSKAGEMGKKKMANGVDKCFTCGLFGGQPELHCEKCGVKLKCELCGLAEVKIHSCQQPPKGKQ